MMVHDVDDIIRQPERFEPKVGVQQQQDLKINTVVVKEDLENNRTLITEENPHIATKELRQRSFFDQLVILIHRSFLTTVRDRVGFIIGIAVMTFLSLLLGCIYW